MKAVIREPVAIGRFYPQNKDQIFSAVSNYFSHCSQKSEPDDACAYMLPHAGYMYCGDVIAKTLCGVHLPETLFIVCPNHTGRGVALSVWPNGVWHMPIGDFKVAEDITDALTSGDSCFTKDYLAHLGEHAIEVLLPFLYFACGQKLPTLVPIALGTQNPTLLRKAAEKLRSQMDVLQKEGRPFRVIISSDMNHYESHEICLQKDTMALERILANDADGLLEVCKKNNITMCGAGPCALFLYALKGTGGYRARLIAHTTSGETSGNYTQTVGYAGIRFYTA